MGTVRFLLLWGCLTLLLSLMVSAHSQHREGDNLDSVRRQNSKNGRQPNRRNENKELKHRTGSFSPVSFLDTSNIMDLSRTSLEKGRSRRQSNGKKNGKPKKPCPGCYSPMGKPQRQKRDLEERESSKKRGHKRRKDKGPLTRGLGRSMKQEKEDSEGRKRERGIGEHRPGSLSGLAIEEEPRKHHAHHKKEKHGKHRKNHQHEHFNGKDEKRE